MSRVTDAQASGNTDWSSYVAHAADDAMRNLDNFEKELDKAPVQAPAPPAPAVEAEPEALVVAEPRFA